MLRDEKSAINSVEELRISTGGLCWARHSTSWWSPPATCISLIRRMRYTAVSSWRARDGDADDVAPLFLRTTEEMLKEFEYLGSNLLEVVITNPGKIADMCEKIAPVRPDKCPPVIENSDQMLRDICYTKAHSMYGEELPSIVKERLDRELNPSFPTAVMYITLRNCVKSNEDGYLVSRGSVGSSFAATMSGITEVNPLQAHYRCALLQVQRL